MIEIDNTFFLGGVQSSLCMQYSPEHHLTQAVIAVIRHRVTKTRMGPPACGNGFETAYLPFAKGHVVALELGGSDNPYNVVPQFEDWQGKPNGAWRAMEISLQELKFANHIMLVEIGYGRNGIPESPEAAFEIFDSNPLRPWTDPRIPDSFHINVWKTDLDVCSIATEADFGSAVNSLKTKVAIFSREFTLGTQMPQPDRANWINRYAVMRTAERYDNYRKIEKQTSFATWFLGNEPIANARTDAMDLSGVTATEAQGIQGQQIICGYQAGMTEPKLRKKMAERGRQNLKSINEKDLYNSRDASPKRKSK